MIFHNLQHDLNLCHFVHTMETADSCVHLLKLAPERSALVAIGQDDRQVELVKSLAFTLLFQANIANTLSHTCWFLLHLSRGGQNL